jgi:hypothetical protein
MRRTAEQFAREGQDRLTLPTAATLVVAEASATAVTAEVASQKGQALLEKDAGQAHTQTI